MRTYSWRFVHEEQQQKVEACSYRGNICRKLRFLPRPRPQTRADRTRIPRFSRAFVKHILYVAGRNEKDPLLPDRLYISRMDRTQRLQSLSPRHRMRMLQYDFFYYIFKKNQNQITKTKRLSKISTGVYFIHCLKSSRASESAF